MKKKTRAILTGFIPIFLVGGVILTIFLLGSLPGFVGEVFRKIGGIMFTPFFLEASFAFIGLIAVLCINKIRLQREGDDYVAMEIKDKPEDLNS